MHSSEQPTLSATDLNTSELVELLRRSAIEHLTTYRQLVARDFGSVATIVTTDFEALYAYKHGDYQRCLQLSTENVRMLLFATSKADVATDLLCMYLYLQRAPTFPPTLPKSIPLWPENIWSILLQAAYMRIDYFWCSRRDDVCMSQLTLSLYLMTQCQVKLRHSPMSLFQTLNYIQVARGRHSASREIDQLALELIELKTRLYMEYAWLYD